MLGDLITCDVRCHDEDGIFTFDGLPLTVCEATLTQFMNVTFVNVFIKQKQRTNLPSCRYIYALLCVFVYTPHQRAAA